MIADPAALSSHPSASSFIARHGVMRFLGEFQPPPDLAVHRHDTVIIRTERGQEVGQALCPATPQAVAAIPDPTRGEIIRLVTEEERTKNAHPKDVEKREFQTAEMLIGQHKL